MQFTEELTSAYLLGILGKASHGPTCSHVHMCVRVVTHSPTRTLRIEGGVLALKREWGSCPKMRKGRKAFRAECRTWAGDEGLSPPRSAACWRFSRRRGALPTRRQPGRRVFEATLRLAVLPCCLDGSRTPGSHLTRSQSQHCLPSPEDLEAALLFKPKVEAGQGSGGTNAKCFLNWKKY